MSYQLDWRVLVDACPVMPLERCLGSVHAYAEPRPKVHATVRARMFFISAPEGGKETLKASHVNEWMDDARGRLPILQSG